MPKGTIIAASIFPRKEIHLDPKGLGDSGSPHTVVVMVSGVCEALLSAYRRRHVFFPHKNDI